MCCFADGSLLLDTLLVQNLILPMIVALNPSNYDDRYNLAAPRSGSLIKRSQKQLVCARIDCAARLYVGAPLHIGKEHQEKPEHTDRFGKRLCTTNSRHREKKVESEARKTRDTIPYKESVRSGVSPASFFRRLRQTRSDLWASRKNSGLFSSKAPWAFPQNPDALVVRPTEVAVGENEEEEGVVVHMTWPSCLDRRVNHHPPLGGRC